MKMTPAQRKHMMLHDPVERIIPRLAIPTIISMLITTVYNAADTFFVSQLDTAASGAVGVVFSVMAIIQAVRGNGYVWQGLRWFSNRRKVYFCHECGTNFRA